MIETMLLLAGAALVAFIPLTIDYVRDGKALKHYEKEEKLLDRIEQIETKYGIEITDKDLEMPRKDNR